MIFGHNYFISEPFSKFCGTFTTQGLQKDCMIIFFVVFQKSKIMKKMQFPKAGVQTVT